jgi:hypothetical protein
MNKLIFFIALVLVGCGGTSTPEQKSESEEQENKEATSSLQLNNGAKWKADSTTQINVGALTRLVNNSAFSDKRNATHFSALLQNRLDTLVKQCKMTGPAHEALHAWLKPVLHDARELKEGENDQNYAQLKKDVQTFYQYFE